MEKGELLSEIGFRMRTYFFEEGKSYLYVRICGKGEEHFHFFFFLFFLGQLLPPGPEQTLKPIIGVGNAFFFFKKSVWGKVRAIGGGKKTFTLGLADRTVGKRGGEKEKNQNSESLKIPASGPQNEVRVRFFLFLYISLFLDFVE